MAIDVKRAAAAAPPPVPSAVSAADKSVKSLELGSYEILDRLGGGGMGDVYRARHTRIGRQVAIKVLKENLPNRAEASRRFLEEARAVNNIGHPNIIDIYDFVELQDRQPPVVFLVMELLEGKDLSAYVAERGPLPFAEAVAIAMQVTAALSAVHGRGLLHRDLKPGNIYLTPEDKGPPRVTVLDFGAIKPIDGDDLELTGPGMAVGTPWYMAPEQVMDKALDPRTDIYSLGVVLYKMLTGQVPFEDASLTKLMVLIARSRPRRPSELREEAIPESLEAIVLRCLQKRPSGRFEDMAAMQRALGTCQSELAPSASDGDSTSHPITEPVGAGPEETRAIRTSLPRPPWLIPLSILAALLIVSGLVTLFCSLGASEPATADAGVDVSSSVSPVTDAASPDLKKRQVGKRKRRVKRPRRRPPRRIRGRRSKKKVRDDKPPNLKIVDPFKK